MKAFLMHRGRDFDTGRELPAEAPELIQDLGLDIILNAMADGDAFLHTVAKTALLASLADPDDIRYRQAVLRDCLANASVVRAIYDLVVETIEKERKHYWGLSTRHPGFILHRSVDMLGVFVDSVRRLRRTAEVYGERFESEGFSTLFATLRRELDDGYLASVEAHAEQLRFRRGPLISARLGAERIAGTELVLRRPNRDGRPWLQRLVSRAPSYTFRLHERDEAGGQILGDLRDRGLSLVANAAGQAVDHMVSFFSMLRTELAFYMGCLNLHEKLAAKGLPVCFPTPRRLSERWHQASGLYDVALALSSGFETVGNDLAANDKDLLVVTGANQGGKTTWLRAVGQSQLMM
jgi:hypothetical protein